MPPCRLRRRKFWKFDYKMVHSEVYLNKYVVSIAPFSHPTHSEICFLHVFAFNFSSIFPGGSADPICPCADAHAVIATISIWLLYTIKHNRYYTYHRHEVHNYLYQLSYNRSGWNRKLSKKVSNVYQGSVATQSKCGWVICDDLATNILLNLSGKKNSKVDWANLRARWHYLLKWVFCSAVYNVKPECSI